MTLDDIVNYALIPKEKLLEVLPKIEAGLESVVEEGKASVDETKFMLSDPGEWARRRAIMAGQNVEEFMDETTPLDLVGLGTIHRLGSKLFPNVDYKELKNMAETGASKRDIWDFAHAKYGFGVYPEKIGGRTDWLMERPDISVTPGRRSVVPRMDERDVYKTTDFIRDKELESYIPEVFSGSQITRGPQPAMFDAPAVFRTGKYGDAGKTFAEFSDQLTSHENIRPAFMEMIQQAIQNKERLPRAGTGLADDTRFLAGNVMARNVGKRYEVIDQMRGLGYTDEQIADWLKKHPPFQTQEVVPEIQYISPRQQATQGWSEFGVPQATYKERTPTNLPDTDVAHDIDLGMQVLRRDEDLEDLLLQKQWLDDAYRSGKYPEEDLIRAEEELEEAIRNVK